jgi:hypothetical protein
MNEGIRVEEYKYLQQEHQKNKGYIFERPVLIISIITFAAQFLIQYHNPANVSVNLSEHGQDILASPIMRPIMILALVFILIFNLAFISTRIKSDSRLVAYIQLFHEGDLVPYWLGWETSLRFYRKWRKDNSNNLKEKLEDKIDSSLYHLGWFYPSIYFFHALFILGLLFLSLSLFAEISHIHQYFYVLFSIGLCIVIIFSQSNPWKPSRHYNLLDVERAIWFEVVNEYEKEIISQLKKASDSNFGEVYDSYS